MSIKIPNIVPVLTFDAAQDKVFSFEMPSGSDRIVANALLIKRQSDGQIVYSKRIETYQYKHTLPANTLTNGEYYSAAFVVYGESGGFNRSRTIQFRTYSAPTLTITNIPESGIVDNASYEFDFVYTQAQNEPIANYRVRLYNDEEDLIYESDVVFLKGDETIDGRYDGKYVLSGLSDDTAYGIEIFARTRSVVGVSSGIHRFYARYYRSGVKTQLKLSNNCAKGSITVASNIILIEGESNPSPAKYIEDKEVDLTEKGDFVRWANGYNIDGDFVMRAWFRKPNANTEIINMLDDSGNVITFYYGVGYKDANAVDAQAYVMAKVGSKNGLSAIYYSNYIDVLPEQEYYCLSFMKQSNNYQIELTKVM